MKKTQKETYFALAVTFFVGIIVTIFTMVPGPWSDDEKRSKRGKK